LTCICLLFSHGIYKSHWCSSKILNHGVLAIGYGKLKDEPYWLVKNSWGTKWGMKGYIMMAKDHRNMCGIASIANYPIVYFFNSPTTVSHFASH
uniref:Pept_C1 domain-containing protein n=1 Tax=Rodentolepis nana TaxID=102285 RepID=A0A0R3TJA0_RODNA